MGITLASNVFKCDLRNKDYEGETSTELNIICCAALQVTTRAVVHALLCDRKETQEKAAALMYNLALKEVDATWLSTNILIDSTAH